jgi:hypothetical protein
MPYSPAVSRCLVCALVALTPAIGRADGLAVVGGSPRAIGRAGAAVVGDDGAGALLINPAAMARRDTLRGEIGAAVIDDTVEWESDAIGAPRSSGRAGSRLAPVGAMIGAIGGWVLGVGVMTAAAVERALPRPGDVPGTAPDKLGATYDYRYAGIAGSYRRDTVALGVARRLGDSLALGAALGAARVAVYEHRRIWASAAARDPDAMPEADLDLRVSATDPISLSAVAGLLYAPAEAPIEVGASVGWTDVVQLDGTVRAVGSPDTQIAVTTDAARATMHVAQPVAVRAGARYVGDRVVAELDGDLWIARPGSESIAWSIRGLSVADGTQPAVEPHRVPSRIAQQSHLALRTAVDVALVPGFLWATAGYAFSTRGTPAARLSPSFGDLGGHTLGLGLETTAGCITVTLGWSRTWSQMTSTPSELRLDSAYPGSDGPVLPGTYDGGSIDQVGVLVAAEIGGR